MAHTRQLTFLAKVLVTGRRTAGSGHVLNYSRSVMWEKMMFCQDFSVKKWYIQKKMSHF